MKKLTKIQLLDFIECMANQTELRLIAIEMLEMLTPKQINKFAPSFKEAIVMKCEDEDDDDEHEQTKKEEVSEQDDEEEVVSVAPEGEKIMKEAKMVDISKIPKEVRDAMLKEDPKIFDDLDDIIPDDDEEDEV